MQQNEVARSELIGCKLAVGDCDATKEGGMT
jgi:hypothetical protein